MTGPVPGPVRCVAVVEDHELYRQAVTRTLQARAGIERVASTATAEAAIEALTDEPVDLVLVDASLPGMSGIDLITWVGVSWPAIRCVVLSGRIDAALVRRAVDAGAAGYVLKGRRRDLDDALDAVARGELFVSDLSEPPPRPVR